jgi:protein TonB
MLANYIKNKQDGIQTRYYENGQVKRENFKKGRFIDGKCFEENGLEIEFFIPIKTTISWRHESFL